MAGSAERNLQADSRRLAAGMNSQAVARMMPVAEKSSLVERS
jgi:hypothetical protein